MNKILSFIAMLHCPDYGQAMTDEFSTAAPSCSFLECTDDTLNQLRGYTKSMRLHASRQTNQCIRQAIMDYADWLDEEAGQQRREWEKMRQADEDRAKIRK